MKPLFIMLLFTCVLIGSACQFSKSDAVSESHTTTQTTAVSVDTPYFDQFVSFLSKYWYFIVIIYEAGARLFKTKFKFWSIIELLYTIINHLVPNRAVSSDKDTNHGPRVGIMKHLFGRSVVHL